MKAVFNSWSQAKIDVNVILHYSHFNEKFRVSSDVLILGFPIKYEKENKKDKTNKKDIGYAFETLFDFGKNQKK